MAKYLIRASYTAEGARGLMKDGGSRRQQVVRDMMKAGGGTLDAFYFALGENDAYLIVDAPDLVTVAAITLAVNASGAVRSNTTVLLTPEDMDLAARKSTNYTPPGK
jgi:uncharacterized protein with GYD domain